MKKIAEFTSIRDDIYETLMMSYQEMLNALKFVEEVFPDVFTALSVDPDGLLRDAEEVFKEVERGGKIDEL